MDLAHWGVGGERAQTPEEKTAVRQTFRVPEEVSPVLLEMSLRTDHKVAWERAPGMETGERGGITDGHTEPMILRVSTISDSQCG